MQLNMSNRIASIARDVMHASPMALATNFGSTLSGADGGYAVPVQAAEEILMPTVGALLPYCRQIPLTSGSSIGMPLDAATPFSDAGIVCAWEDEGAVLPQQKPKLDMTSFSLKKLIALVPVTDQLLEDSDALAAYLPLAMQTAVTRKVNDAIINGTGAGTALGILKSGAVITVAKEGGQAADSIVDANIANMLDRAIDPMSSIWVMNPRCYGHASSFLAGFDGPTRTLAGLPIVTTDSCPELGEFGDLILADMAWYLAVLKTPQLNSSMHLWFDQDMTAFRLTFRMDGSPAIVAPVTPPNSPVTRSHFVALAQRA
ncbi:phage major capsid protein [Thiobacillus sp.]|uniref:phage major capsid protein n=1 Tax=Thiobacillus sp. TaxID=924 RepID=UPI00286E37D3|nr:phage major capsid protein [Thiobacillus sp.]